METTEDMLSRMGLRMSKPPTWSPEDRAAYRDKHASRDHSGHHDDIEIAASVRMLMRDDLAHEGLVCAARDRICALAKEKDELLEALKQMVQSATYGTFDHADSHPLPVARAAIARATGASS